MVVVAPAQGGGDNGTAGRSRASLSLQRAVKTALHKANHGHQVLNLFIFYSLDEKQRNGC